MKLAQITISESASVDVQSNQLSIFNIIENLQIAGSLPVQYPRMVLVSVWESDDLEVAKKDERVMARIIVSAKDSSTTLGDEFDITLLTGQNKVRAIVNLAGVPINKIGTNKISLEIKKGTQWHEAGAVSILVTTI